MAKLDYGRPYRWVEARAELYFLAGHAHERAGDQPDGIQLVLRPPEKELYGKLIGVDFAERIVTVNAPAERRIPFSDILGFQLSPPKS
ncbi:MAG: hypothetical protein ACJ75R_04730 [Solirubrobacterales bacterium]